MKKPRQGPDLGFSETTFHLSGYSFDSETLDDSWTFSDAWLMTRAYGERGSPQYFVEQLKHSLMAIELLSLCKRLPTKTRKEIRLNYGIAIEALLAGGSEFFRTVVDGLEAREKKRSTKIPGSSDFSPPRLQILPNPKPEPPAYQTRRNSNDQEDLGACTPKG
jgi:hypothetical protein